MHEEVDSLEVSKTDYRFDRLEVSKTDYRFEAINKSFLIEEIPLFLDYSNFMFSLFILVAKETYFDSCSERSDFFLF